MDYILDGVNYQTLILMLSDAPRYVRKKQGGGNDDSRPEHSAEDILSESENTTEGHTGTSGILRHTDDLRLQQMLESGQEIKINRKFIEKVEHYSAMTVK